MSLKKVYKRERAISTLVRLEDVKIEEGRRELEFAKNKQKRVHENLLSSQEEMKNARSKIVDGNSLYIDQLNMLSSYLKYKSDECKALTMDLLKLNGVCAKHEDKLLKTRLRKNLLSEKRSECSEKINLEISKSVQFSLDELVLSKYKTKE